MTVHESSIVSSKAKLGSNVEIGPFTIVHDNVEIKDDVVIEGHCEIGVSNHLSNGELLPIGESSHVRSHSVFYEGSTFGKRLVTGHRVTVREKTRAGENLQIGTLSDIQGHCQIGDFVRFHSNVHVGQQSEIGNFVWIFPYCVLTNDPHPPSEVQKGVIVDDFAVISTMSVILPGVKIAKHVLIGAHSLVNSDTEEGMLYAGSPAKLRGSASKIKLQDGTDRPAYPWTQHFARGYRKDVTKNWPLNRADD